MSPICSLLPHDQFSDCRSEKTVIPMESDIFRSIITIGKYIYLNLSNRTIQFIYNFCYLFKILHLRNEFFRIIVWLIFTFMLNAIGSNANLKKKMDIKNVLSTLKIVRKNEREREPEIRNNVIQLNQLTQAQTPYSFSVVWRAFKIFSKTE